LRPDKHPLTQSLDAIRPEDVEIYGGKATNIARLSQAGFHTPRGFSISSDSFVQMQDEIPEVCDILRRLEDIDDFEEIINQAQKLQMHMESYKLPEFLVTAILNQIQKHEQSCMSVEFGYAVRSSATIEDSEDISFAGQAQSCLCVKGVPDIMDAVKQVWASIYSPNVAIYLKARGVSIHRVKMAVLVQEMIPAEISGVMFTANVVSNNRDEIIINATWGLGESLVSGKVIPDTYIVAKNPLKLVHQERGTKEITSTAQASGNGVRIIISKTPKKRQDVLTLDDHTLEKLAKLGLEIEREMGSPQDIEWCINPAGEIIVLQSRPITTLRILL
jgi:pyruvate,water dikinase